jgi:hypothetical protein
MDKLAAAKAYLGPRYCLAVPVQRIPHDRPVPLYLMSGVTWCRASRPKVNRWRAG